MPTSGPQLARQGATAPAASNGLRGSIQDKRNAVYELLGDAEWAEWRDCEIVKHLGADYKTVAAQRESICGNPADAPTVCIVKRYIAKHDDINTMKPKVAEPHDLRAKC